MANEKETNKELEKVVTSAEVLPNEIAIPLSEFEAVDVSDKYLEKMARGFILGSESVSRRKEVREQLEEKVVKKIGRKGKYLTDKLFELIEGVYVIDKRGGKDGRSVRYYQVPPNLNAITYALDRVLGKPKVQIDKSEEKRGIVLVEHVIRNLASKPYGQGRSAGGTTADGGREGTGTGEPGTTVTRSGDVDKGVGAGVI